MKKKHCHKYCSLFQTFWLPVPETPENKFWRIAFFIYIYVCQKKVFIYFRDGLICLKGLWVFIYSSQHNCVQFPGRNKIDQYRLTNTFQEMKIRARIEHFMIDFDIENCISTFETHRYRGMDRIGGFSWHVNE